MATVLRFLGSIVAAMLVAFALVMAVEFFSAAVHPLPADFGGTVEEMCAHVARYPAWVLAIVVPMWAGIALASTLVAGRLGNRGSAAFVGLLLLAAAAFNVSMLPYPTWFKLASPIAIVLANIAGVYWSPAREIGAASIP